MVEFVHVPRAIRDTEEGAAPMSDDAPLEPISPEPAAPEGAPSAPAETATQAQVPAGASTPAPPPGTPETPGRPATPETAATPATPVTPGGEAPTQPVAGTTPPGPPPWGPPPAGASTPGAPRSSTVAVPKWVLAVVGALVIALIGFGVGYAVAPGGDSDSTASTRIGPGPFGGLNPNQNPNLNPDGNGNQLPTVPGPGNLQGGFLGVVSTTSSDPDGARITQVVSDSPAADAGLRVDDVITKVGGDAVANPAELARRIQAEDPGDTVTITYVRDGDTKTTDVKVVSRRNGLRESTPSTTTPGQ
jgi:hypothetical protein